MKTVFVLCILLALCVIVAGCCVRGVAPPEDGADSARKGDGDGNPNFGPR